MTLAGEQRIISAVRAVPDEYEERVINLIIPLCRLVSSEEQQNEITVSEPVSLPFDPDFTEENREERMNRFFEARGRVQIDRDAVRELRERSMV